MSRRAQPNPYVGITYIPDNLRMEVPPAYFLQRLHDYDAMLVVLPSRKTPFAYVIARRKQYSKGLTDAAIESTIVQPDTKMCMLYDLVPVCLMFKTGSSWNADPILEKLKARDLWAHGGADKVADMLEEQEEAERQKLRAEIRDDIWNRSGDAWRSYQHRTGQSTVKTKDFHPRKRGSAATSAPSSSSTAGWVSEI